jgi:predicted ester cyclase
MSSTGSNAAKIESNRTLGRRFFAEQDRLLGGPAPELCAPEYKAHLGGNPPVDRAGHEGFAKAFYAAFPDMRHDVELSVADEDSVAVRFVIRGTSKAPFFGIPATGKPVTVCANVILRVRDGKVTELFGAFDEAGLLRQLGVLPAG